MHILSVIILHFLFKECVHALNKLQSNAQTLEKTRLTRDKLAPLHVPNMIKWASRVGISVNIIVFILIYKL
jgi:hypothetical protein